MILFYFQLYLKNFGYIEESTGGIIGLEAVSIAIKDFQKFAGLSETGNCTLINNQLI